MSWRKKTVTSLTLCMFSAMARLSIRQIGRPAVFMSYNTEEYEALPAAVRAGYTLKEFMWLPADEKRRIIEDNTMPEVAEDG